MKKCFFVVVFLLLSFANAAYSQFPKAINSSLVTSIAHDANHLYVGTRYGLTIIDKQTGDQTVIGGSDAAENYIYTMRMHEDTLWMGRKCTTLSYYANGSMHTFQPLLNSRYFYGLLAPPMVTAIAFSPTTGKQHIGLETFFGEVSETEPKDCIDTGVWDLEGAIQDIEADSSGSIWLYSDCHSSPLKKYSEENGLEEILKNFSNSDIPIIKSKNDLGGFCMTIGTDGHIWMGNRTGYLVEFDGEAFKVYPLPIAQGDKPFDLTFDNDGILWMLSYKGTLVRYDGKDFEAHQLDMQDGEVAFCMDIDGSTIYAGTNKRVIAFTDGVQTSIELSIATSISSPTNNAIMSSSYFDLQGRQLNGKPEKGIYIQNGKKVKR